MFLTSLIIGALLGAAIGGIIILAVEVAERISKWNISDIVKRVLRRNDSDAVRKAIAGGMTGKIKEKDIEEVTISFLENGEEKIELTLKSDGGIASDIYEGMKIPMYS